MADDEADIRSLIRQYLEFDGYLCVEAQNGLSAVEFCKRVEFDLIILDIMMPELDGLEAMRQIREFSDTPIILLTAKGTEYDKVMGLDLGADDYMVKPFSPRELMARIRVRLKHMDADEKQQGEVYSVKGLTVNMTSYEVYLDGSKLELTPKEFELLRYFIKHKGVVINRETLLHQIWGYSFAEDTRTIDTHIKMLRGKLGPYRDMIKTVWGVGYRYDDK